MIGGDTVKILYKCDPEKNKDCVKRICYTRRPKLRNPCRSTKNPEYAVLNDQGKPIINYVRLDDLPDKADGGDW